MTTVIDRTIQLSGLTFHYREAGDPDAPPVVLLHALTYDARNWDEIASFLSRRYRVLALDQRGHGQSARPGSYSFELMCEDLKSFADNLGLSRFTLIGHSMGGGVACLFATQWPERLERLVLEDSAPIDPSEEVNLPAPSEEPPGDVPFDWNMLVAVMKQIQTPEPSWWYDLAKLTVPTLIIGGGSTSEVPHERLAGAARLMPDAQLVTVEGAGHYVHDNRPDEYKELLRQFLFEETP
jgi:esterase